MKRFITYFLLSVVMVLASCSDNDSFSTNRNNLLTFSVDTVKMDTVFANTGSSTYSFWVFNQSGDGIRLNSVRLRNGNQTGFRVNVDGSYLDNKIGSVVNDLEVRKGDSIRVFVELTAAATQQLEPQQIAEDLVFQLESGVEQRVRLESWVWDADKITNLTVSADTLIESAKPLVFFGTGITVDSGAVLTLRNTTLFFHDRAGIDVNGSLITKNVVMRGDRLDHMFDYLPYDRVSGQWRGIVFGVSSTENAMFDTEVRNAERAVVLTDSAVMDSTVQRLTMVRCVVHNSKGYGVISYNSYIGLYYCLLANTMGDCLALYGGICEMEHCTLAQFYPFTANRGAALRFSNKGEKTPYPLLMLFCTNSIVTGYDKDVVFAEYSEPDSITAGQDSLLFCYQFENCLLRTPAVEDDTVSFHNIIWETPDDSIQGKKHFKVFDEENLYYDFHLDSLSTAHGLGCYEE